MEWAGFETVSFSLLEMFRTEAMEVEKVVLMVIPSFRFCDPRGSVSLDHSNSVQLDI